MNTMSSSRRRKRRRCYKTGGDELHSTYRAEELNQGAVLKRSRPGTRPEPKPEISPEGSIRTSGWVLIILSRHPAGQLWGFTLCCFLLRISCRSLNASWWWSACQLLSLCLCVCLWWHRYARVKVKGHWTNSLSLDSQPKSWWVIRLYTGSLWNC